MKLHRTLLLPFTLASVSCPHVPKQLLEVSHHHQDAVWMKGENMHSFVSTFAESTV